MMKQVKYKVANKAQNSFTCLFTQEEVDTQISQVVGQPNAIQFNSP